MTSITVTTDANAKVVKPSLSPECALDCEDVDCASIDWAKVLLIEEHTLKSISSDAKGYRSALEELVKAQADLNRVSKKLTKALESVSDAEVALREVAAPPWYESPPIWAAIGLVVGVFATTAIQLTVDSD